MYIIRYAYSALFGFCLMYLEPRAYYLDFTKYQKPVRKLLHPLKRGKQEVTKLPTYKAHCYGQCKLIRAVT